MLSEDQGKMLDVVKDRAGSIASFGCGAVRRTEKELVAVGKAKLESAKAIMAGEYEKGADEKARFADELLGDVREIIKGLVVDHFAEVKRLEDSPEADLPASVLDLGKDGKAAVCSGGRVSRAGELKARAGTAKRGLRLMQEYAKTVTELRQTNPRLPWEPNVSVGVRLDGYSELVGGSGGSVVDGEVVNGADEFDKFVEGGGQNG